MRIRKSTPADLAAIMEIFERAKQFMRQTGNTHQWTGAYPSPELLLNDIQNGKSYVVVSDKPNNKPDTEQDTKSTNKTEHLAGTFYFAIEADPTYNYIEGNWLNTDTYGVVHRIASNGSQKGLAAFCLDWCYTQIPNLKIDTHRQNHVMQNIVQKTGFTYCGIIYLENGDERLAYQKAP